jgi:hypothetical protein
MSLSDAWSHAGSGSERETSRKFRLMRLDAGILRPNAGNMRAVCGDERV